MSFMGGLGSGFKSSFEAGNQRIHEKRMDAFRMAYDNWSKKKDEYASSDAKWKSHVKAGELLAERYGAPPEAALKAAEWLSNGYSEAYVDEMMKTTKFELSTDAISPQTTSMVPGVGDAETQMQASGLADPIEPTPQTPEPAKEDTGLLGGLFDNMGKPEQQRTDERLQRELGISPEEFNQVNEGFQPPSIPKMKMTPQTQGTSPLAEFGLDEDSGGITPASLHAAKAEAAINAKSGDPVAQAKAKRFAELLPYIELTAAAEDVSAEGKTEILKQLAVIDKPLQDIVQKRAAVDTALTTSKQVADMVENSDGRVLTLVSKGAAFFETVRTEVNSAASLFTRLTGGDPNAIVAEEDLLDAVLDTTSGMAQEYREFNAAIIPMVYAAARANGAGGGNGISNKEFDIWYGAIVNSNSVPAFINNLKRIARESFLKVDNEASYFFNSPQVQMMIDPEAKEPSYVKLNTLLTDSLGPLDENIDPALIEWMNTPYKGKEEDNTRLKVGTIEVDDETGIEYEYIGGDPSVQSNWKPLPTNKAK